MQPVSYKKKGIRICDTTGWFWSEKLDGMKGRWINGEMLTRSGQKIEVPKWFSEQLPKKHSVEGELYFGKGTFHKTGVFRRTSSGSVDSMKRRVSENTWKKVEFHIFDLIDYQLTWVERQNILSKIITENSSIYLVKWKKIKSSEYLEKHFSKVIKKGGEGVILADPWGIYEDGKVEQILKYKKQLDNEAIVTGYRTDDSGQRLASLEVRMGNIEFHIGTGFKVKQRYNFRKKFPVGCKVTFTYELVGKNKKPRSPVFKGLRVDL